MRKILLPLVLLSGALAAPAAAQDDTTSQLWLDYADHFYLTKTWEFYGEIGYRLEPEDGSWQQFLGRPSMRWHPTLKWYEGRGGADVRWANNEGLPSELELRPWLGGLVKWPTIRRLGLSFTHFVRLEWRLRWENDDWSLESTGRLRYKLTTKIPVARGNRVAGYFFVPLGIEWFQDEETPLRERFAARVRPEIGLGYVIDGVWVAEAHFYGQRSRAFGDESFETTEYILRLQVKRLWSARDYLSRE